MNDYDHDEHGPVGITATWAVHAGTTRSDEFDPGELPTDPDELAAFIDASIAADPAVCHECADTIVDPEVGDLAGFAVHTPDGDIEYVRSDDGTYYRVGGDT